MPKSSSIQKWLEASDHNEDQYKQKKAENLQKFLDFVQKTPKQIINENKSLPRKEFKKTYSKHLNSFISHLKKKKLEPNTMREIISAVQDFFRYTNLPLSLGIRGHFNLFLK